jgi:arsenate reductase-like glutaredoxin family protein
MSESKTLKQILESLEDEIRSLRYTSSKLTDVLENDIKIRIAQDQSLEQIKDLVEVISKRDIKDINIGTSVFQTLHATIINTLAEFKPILLTGIKDILEGMNVHNITITLNKLDTTINKLDDSIYRLVTTMKEQYKTTSKEQEEITSLLREIKAILLRESKLREESIRESTKLRKKVEKKLEGE